MSPLTEQEVRTFVGPRADYYLRKWQPALQGDGGAEGFNWVAFLLSGLWLPYRMMYLPMFILFSLVLIETVLEDVLFVGVLKKEETPAAVGYLVGLVVGIICGACGNRWYLARARSVIAEVRSQGLPEEEHLRVLSTRGGTNALASLGCFVLYIAVVFAVFFVMERLFAKG